MQTATITIKYVNPPKGKGPASVKDTNGVYWKFWPRDIPVDRFAAGQSYTVLYKTEPYNGEDQYYIQEVTGGQASAPAPQKSNGHAPEVQRRTSPTDAERMFVCSILNASVQSGKVDFITSDLTEAVNVLRSVWQTTFGRDAA